MYKSAFLGCSRRQKAHARAYEYVKKGKYAAACDLNSELLNAFGREFEITSLYTDFHEMLE